MPGPRTLATSLRTTSKSTPTAVVDGPETPRTPDRSREWNSRTKSPSTPRKRSFSFRTTGSGSKNGKALRSTLEDESLRRGMPAFHALACFASIFRSGQGSEETWSLSAPVPRIRWFISHNWSVSRWEKLLVLCWHFNWYPAVFTTCLLLLVMLLLTATGSLPLVEVHEDGGVVEWLALWAQEERAPMWAGVWAQPTTTWMFLLVLFTWHEVAGRLGALREPVFLDKACISQTDDGLKQKGIESLAAFLCDSDGMLVIYTDVYLRKMWTVFELASLLILYPEKEVIVVPTIVPKIVALGSLFTHVYFRMLFFWEWAGTSGSGGRTNLKLPVVLVMVLLEVALCYVARYLCRREHDIQAAAAAFRIGEAQCFDEKDRGIVCKSVASFMRQEGHVSQETSCEDCLKAFDELVHKKVPRCLVRSMERGLPYTTILAILLPLPGGLVDRVGADIYYQKGASEVLRRSAFLLGRYLLICPVAVKLATLTMRTCLQLRGWREHIFVASVGMAFCAFGIFLNESIAAIMGLVEQGTYHDLLLQSCVWVLFAILNCFLYRPRQAPAKDESSQGVWRQRCPLPR